MKRDFFRLRQAIDIYLPSDVERAGIIQFFEMTFELGRKLIKDYLEELGSIVKGPKDAIKQAFREEIIKHGHDWINALETRNLTVYTYDEQTAIQTEQKIRQEYFPALQDLYDFMKNKA